MRRFFLDPLLLLKPHEQEAVVREAVEVAAVGVVDGRFLSEAAEEALGAAGDGARVVEGGAARRGTGDEEGGERRQALFEAVHRLLERLHIFFSDARFCPEAREVRHEGGKLLLQREHALFRLFFRGEGTREAEDGVDLVHRAVDGDAQRGFLHAFPRVESRLTGVTRFRVDAHGMLLSVVVDLRLVEEDRDFPRCTLRAVGRVDGIAAAIFGIRLADRPLGGLGGIRLAIERAHAADRILALEHHGDERTGRHEVAESLVVRAADVLGVVDGGQAVIHAEHLEGGDAQPLLLVALDDVSRMMMRECVRFDEYKRLFHETIFSL